MEHAPKYTFVDADRPAGVEDAEYTPARFFALFLFEFSPVAHLTYRSLLLSFANHSDISGLARSLALSFSRVAAARRIPVLPHLLPLNSQESSRQRAGLRGAFTVILLPHSWGRIQEGVAGAFTPAEVKQSTRSDFLTPEQSSISVILRVPRGESRLPEDRELGLSALSARRMTNHGSSEVNENRKVIPASEFQ